jgi:hypothetical protein
MRPQRSQGFGTNRIPRPARAVRSLEQSLALRGDRGDRAGGIVLVRREAIES